MQRRIPILLLLLLSLLLVLAMGAASSAAPMAPDAPDGTDQAKAGYVGSNACRGCHNTIHTSLQQTLHPWKVRPKDQAEIVGQFPVEMNGVTYTLDSFDWVIGAKPAWKQRYIDIEENGFWRILPIQWNIETQAWVRYNAPAADYRDACAGCHTTGYNVETKEWIEPGISCEACHGPAQQHVQGGFINPPGQRGVYIKPDAEVCGACHTRGKTKDGLYSWPEGYIPGGAVSIADVYNPTVAAGDWWYDNPEDATDPYHAKNHHQQYLEWEKSAHANALNSLSGTAAPVCLGCHSEDYRRDNTLTRATAEFGVTCQTCHVTHDPGVADGQLAMERYALCVSCHTGRIPATGVFDIGTAPHHPAQPLFEGFGFPGLDAMPSPHFTADGGPDCVSCHMVKTANSALPGDITSHRFAVVMPGAAKPGQDDSCSSCHSSAGKDTLQELIDSRQAEIQGLLDNLKAVAAAKDCGDFTPRVMEAGKSDACKLAFLGYKMIERDNSLGMHNYLYARAILRASFEAIEGAVYDLPYVGSLTCAACHGDYYASLQDTIHPWKVRPKEEATIIGQWPVEWNGVTYTLDDVDWVIGARAKWKQRYVSIQEDGKWAILPFQWNVATNALAAYTNNNDYRNACAGCHTTGYDIDVREWKEPGVTCESCHGPGEAHIMAADKVNDPMIYASVDSEVCGACHTRGKSKDGLHDWPEGYVPGGDVHVADVYNPTTATSAWWYDNPNDPTDPGSAKEHRQQYLEWQRSKHATALDTLKDSGHAQTFCLACHSEDYRRDPGNVTVATAQFTIECVTCHASHDPGAPGTSQLLLPQYQLCVQCHNGTSGGARPITPGDTVHHPMQEMYEGRGMPGVAPNPSSHYRATDGGGGPVCSSCHFVRTAKSGVYTNWDNGAIRKGDIASHLLLPVLPGEAVAGEPTACSECHNWGNTALQGVIDMRQNSTQAKLDELDGWLARLMGVDSAEVKLAHTAHSFVEGDGSTGFHNYPYAQSILDMAIDAVDDYRFLYMPTLLRN